MRRSGLFYTHSQGLDAVDEVAKIMQGLCNTSAADLAAQKDAYLELCRQAKEQTGFGL